MGGSILSKMCVNGVDPKDRDFLYIIRGWHPDLLTACDYLIFLHEFMLEVVHVF